MTVTEKRAYSAAKNYTLCPGDAPYAITDGNGNLIACHSVMDDAQEHMAMLDAGDGPMGGGVLMNADSGPVATRSGQSESRSFALPEVRENKSGGWTLFGYASTFNDPYSVTDRYGSFTEQIRPGAWDRSINDRSATIQLLDSHGGLPYAATNSGTMRVSVDKKGLRYEADLSPRQQRAQDLADAVARGDANKMSVGMRIPEGGDRWEEDLRSIHDATLLEISVVNRPANPNTEAGMRNDEVLAEIRRLEGLIRPPTTTIIEGDEWRTKHVANLARLYKLL